MKLKVKRGGIALAVTLQLFHLTLGSELNQTRFSFVFFPLNVSTLSFIFQAGT